VVINGSEESATAMDLCYQMMEKGLLCKPTHGNKIRFAPPLVITSGQMHAACDIIEEVFLQNQTV